MPCGGTSECISLDHSLSGVPKRLVYTREETIIQSKFVGMKTNQFKNRSINQSMNQTHQSIRTYASTSWDTHTHLHFPPVERYSILGPHISCNIHISANPCISTQASFPILPFRAFSDGARRIWSSLAIASEINTTKCQPNTFSHSTTIITYVPRHPKMAQSCPWAQYRVL